MVSGMASNILVATDLLAEAAGQALQDRDKNSLLSGTVILEGAGRGVMIEWQRVPESRTWRSLGALPTGCGSKAGAGLRGQEAGLG